MTPEGERVPPPPHVPVMVREVVRAFEGFPGGVFLDATVGYGGHGAAILEEVRGIETYVGIDRDREALEAAALRLAGAPPSVPVSLRHGDFRDLRALLEEGERGRVGGALFDLGVSSPQIDRAERGFSHRLEGELDMRMDRTRGKSARDLVNEYPAEKLEEVIRRYGEERNARAVARAIVRAREVTPIEDTARLAEVVGRCLHPRHRIAGLSRVFQSFRVEVNDEIRALEEGLDAAVEALAPGGLIAVLSYHSLEDRVVKSRFRDWARGCVCPPRLPTCRCGRSPVLRLHPRRAVRPRDEEVSANGRARSARLRVGVRVGPAGSRKEGRR
ncbi:MAG: 16S rRNA (cytosine(1402)-N(4))-methyltransferase RsmH [Candidatus Eisenbacteria bacterium]